MDQDLSEEELRVLASLVEKAATTPDQYPLSINGLVQASNQKSNRDPVMALGDADVREAITSLTRRRLVRQTASSGSRVSRFEHRLGRGPGSPLNASPEQLAVLGLLMLRGPQTPGELRTRAHRLAAFADIETVEATLTSLAEHTQGVLVERLPREPGKREYRYRHCLAAKESGVAGVAAAAAPAVPEPTTAADGESLEARVAVLEQEVAELRMRFDEAGDGSSNGGCE